MYTPKKYEPELENIVNAYIASDVHKNNVIEIEESKKDKVEIAENLDIMRANGETDLVMVAAEGEHSAAGVCYGAAVAGGRVVNATSANGLLYALEQFPVQSGTRYPMVMNVVCRTVSGPLSIKGDHSDIMYLLNAGWPILFASTVQQVYDFIRGLSPYPAAWTTLIAPDGTEQVVKVYEAVIIEKPRTLCPIGTISTDSKTYIHVYTSDGALSIRTLQLAGKKRMSVDDFLRGFRLAEGYRFEV